MQRICLLLFLLTALSGPGWGADRFSVATGNWNQTSTWSGTSGGMPGASVPGSADNVFIEGGFTVTLVAAVTASNVTIKIASTLDATSFKLIVNSIFTIEDGGTFKQGGSEVSVPGATKSLAGNSNYIFYGTQAGLSGTFPTYGNLIFQPSPTGPGSFAGNLNVAGNLTINLGTAQEIRFATGTTSRTHAILGNLVILGNSIVVGNSGTTAAANITIGGNLLVSSGTFRGTNSAGNATFNIAGDITNNGTWQLDDGSSTGILSIILNGSSSVQTLDGSDAISFEDLTINNINGVTSGQNFSINGTLTMINGSISTNGYALSYGENGTLKYDGISYNMTSDAEFPTFNGPMNLIINNANSASGLSLHANRTISGTLTVAAGKIFNIPAGLQLTVNGTTTTNGGLVLKSPANDGPTGSFISNGSVTGNITVERYFNGWSTYFGWHFLSSPIVSQSIQPEFVPDPPTASEDFYQWDEVTDLWVNSKSAPGIWNSGFESDFIAGKGYLVAYQTAVTRQFSGIPNTSNFPVDDLTLSSGTNSGWHLLGNPFPSALEWNGGEWGLSNIASTAKIWVESTASYTDIHDSDHDIIPAMNGFFVQVTASPGSLTIPASARVHDVTPWYKNSEKSIRLTAREAEFGTAQTINIRIDEASSDEYNEAFDSRFLPGYAPKFYSMKGQERLSTNTLPGLSDRRIISLGFIKNNASNFTLELNPGNMIPGLVIFLRDAKTNIVQNLSEIPVYSFSSTEGDDPNRFQLVFNNPYGVVNPVKEKVIGIFSMNGSIYISINSNKVIRGDVFVYNLMGQEIMHNKLTGEKLIIMHPKTTVCGYYVVKVITNEKVFSGKVFLL